MPRFFHHILVLCLLIVVAGCQSQTPGDALKLDGENLGDAASVAVAAESIGKGSVLVSMLLNRSGAHAAGSDASNYRDGAMLAVSDLGADHITLSIKDTRSDVGTIGIVVGEALKNNTAMFIIGGDAQLINNTISFTAKNRTPIISLGADALGTKAKVYTFQPDGIETLNSGLKYAAAIGKRKLVLVLSDKQARSDIRRVKIFASRHAKLMGTIVYTIGQDQAAFVKKHQKTLSTADVIVFAGKNHQVVRLADPIRSLSKNPGEILFVGRADWPRNIWKNLANSGVIIATPDASSLGLVKDRFEKKYTRPMLLSAAYAYDVVAIASGLVRARGQKAISRANLEGKSGFRGATGVFRFKADGSVERLYRISQARNGKLVTIREVPDGY